MSFNPQQPVLRALIARNDAAEAEAILCAAEADAQNPKDPFVLRLLLGLAAWVSSLLLIGFIFAAFSPEDFGALAIGILILSGGIVMHYCISQPGAFVQQVTLAVVMCGHLMTLFGGIMVLDFRDTLLCSALIQTALSGLSIRIFPHATYQAATLLLTVVLWTIVSLDINRKKLEPFSGSLVLRIDEHRIAHFSRYPDGTPLAADERLISYKNRRGPHFGIENFFFQEGKGEDYANAKYAKIKLAPNGSAMLVDLVD